MRRTKLTDDIIDQINDLRKSGHTIKEVEKIFNISTNTVRRYTRGEPQLHVITDELIDQINSLRKEGYSSKYIVEKLHISRATVTKYTYKENTGRNKLELNSRTVEDIISMIENGKSVRYISNRFNISITQTRHILKKLNLTPIKVEKVVSYDRNLSTDTNAKLNGYKNSATYSRSLRDKGISIKKTNKISNELNIIRLYNQGYTAPEIAKLTNLRENYIRLVLKNNNIDGKLNTILKRNQKNEEYANNVIDLMNKGYTATEICKILGTYYDRVKKVREKYLSEK